MFLITCTSHQYVSGLSAEMSLALIHSALVWAKIRLCGGGEDEKHH